MRLKILEFVLTFFMLFSKSSLVYAQTPTIPPFFQMISYYKTNTPNMDVNHDGIINMIDLAYSILFGSQVVTPTPSANNIEWTQDAHDAERSGYTPEQAATSWTYSWFWKSPSDANPPLEGRAIMGGGKVYIPVATNGLIALNTANGNQAWQFGLGNGSFNASAGYDSGFVYAGNSNGIVYKINAGSGIQAGLYNTGSPIQKAVLISGSYIYVVTDGGALHKIDKNSMSVVWIYSAGSRSSTPASYSPSRDIIIYATDDLYVHAVNNADGTRKWRVKPSPNAAGWPNTFDKGWPVVAEKHGIVFVRMQLAHSENGNGPNSGRFYTDNEQNRAWLISNPQSKNLFALNLDDGSEKFVPIVGYGSVEDFINGGPYGVMPGMPVIKVWPNGDEVTYIPFRNYQGVSPDYRWSGHMGEMVLDDITIPGMKAGNLRFIRMNNDGSQGGPSYVFIIDEEVPISMAGDYLFNSHWGAAEGVRITDRTAAKGLSYTNPISTTNLPSVIRAQNGCGNVSDHTADCDLTLYNDGRFWNGPGFFMFLNQQDPPVNVVAGGSRGYLPRYTFVGSGYVFFEGNGGDLLVLHHQ